jgi:hypothetical protein
MDSIQIILYISKNSTHPDPNHGNLNLVFENKMYIMVGTFCKRRKPEVHIIMRPVHSIQQICYHSGVFGVFW